MSDQKLVHLEVNEAGAWKRITSFPLDFFSDGDLEICAGNLLELSANTKLKARIIEPGSTHPLVNWTYETGWQEWKGAA
jgi:hypothetical protein